MRGLRDWKYGRVLHLRFKVEYWSDHFRKFNIKHGTILFYMLRYYWKKYLINKEKKAAAKKKKADAAKKKKLKPSQTLAVVTTPVPVAPHGKKHHKDHKADERRHTIVNTPD